MSLGISMRFPVEREGKTMRQYYEEKLYEIAANAEKQLSPVSTVWESFFHIEEVGFMLKLAPFEEAIRGVWRDGELWLTARTSSAGPGYHAWLIKLLDGLGVKPLEVEDETGYYQTRDFALLQALMAGWLITLSEHLIENVMQKDVVSVAISLPIEGFAFPADKMGDDLISCPLGYFEVDFFERAKSGDNVAAEFFIWWNEELDALFYRNMALHMIICWINWLPPEIIEEEQYVGLALASLERAYSMDATLGFPAAEWLELAGLIGDEELAVKLKSRFNDIREPVLGYRRGKVRSIVNGWRFTHDGKMHLAEEEEQGTGSLVGWDDTRTFRVSTLTIKQNEQAASEDAALTLLAIARGDEQFTPFLLRDSDTPAEIKHSKTEENGRTLWYTILHAAFDESLFVMTLFYDDIVDREWAQEVCASLVR